MFVNVWECLGMFGNVRKCLGMFGSVWWMFGNVLECLGKCGNVWAFLGMFGNVSECLGMSGNVCECLWMFVNVSGFPSDVEVSHFRNAFRHGSIACPISWLKTRKNEHRPSEKKNLVVFSGFQWSVVVPSSL